MENNSEKAPFVYIPPVYCKPMAIDCKPSEECKKYHENFKMIMVISDELLRKMSMESNET